MDFNDLLTSGPAIGTAVAGVVAALYKAAKSLLEFNDEYLQKRRFRQYAWLLAEAEEHADLRDFIHLVKREDIFRGVFGKPVSPQTARALVALYQSGRYSMEELRASYLYARLRDDGTLEVKPGAGGAFVLAFTLSLVAAMSVYAVLLIVLFLGMQSWSAALAAAGVLAVYSGLTWLFCRDVRAVILARRVQRRLAQGPDAPQVAPPPASVARQRLGLRAGPARK